MNDEELAAGSGTHRSLLRALDELVRAQREAGSWMARTMSQPRASIGILRMLAGAGPLQVTCIAHRLRVDLSVASRQISALLDAGLVERGVDDGDHRSRAGQLTAAGAALALRCLDLLDTTAASVFADWTPDEVESAVAQLTKLASAIATTIDLENRKIRTGTPLVAAPSH